MHDAHRPVITVCTTLPDFRLAPPLDCAGLSYVLTVFTGRFTKICNLAESKICLTVDSERILGIPGESGATLAARGGPERCPFQQDVVMPYVSASIPKNPTEPPLKASVAPTPGKSVFLVTV